MILQLATANENHWEREGTTEVVPSRTHRSSKVRIFTETAEPQPNYLLSVFLASFAS